MSKNGSGDSFSLGVFGLALGGSCAVLAFAVAPHATAQVALEIIGVLWPAALAAIAAGILVLFVNKLPRGQK